MRRTKILLIVVVSLWGGGGLLLWVLQGIHNHLPRDVETQYPPGQAFEPGEIFASTLSVIMTHELQGGFGWRPNDCFLWGPTMWADDNANRQLGILRAVRESLRVFKDHLTKGPENEDDPDLQEADRLLRADARKFWFPSAESQFSDGIRELRQYVGGLHDSSPRSHPMTTSETELVPLFQVWTDLLDEAHADLYKVREADGGKVWWQTDDYFYRAQGYVHVIDALMQALARENSHLVGARLVMQALFDEARAALSEAALMNPPVILNGSPSGIFANHRRNLDTYISEARLKMSAIREELGK